ncbi:probable transmembrane GTPase FZO-like, chloroplastic [Benincasa hispida]|uniref:probable transmembrane GTPase FZO-like, chloroplastic n=1 Tax=Benincasa hispida TaxID=102211 RepID=UPI0018FF3860|nr:probable transmembrane GTPase FZO-like, chloroplastic [Benincasa hispida]XP_038887625.1 probable transmembrane GTPase FZO-like, chloroplastic [Benincasa hispida]
MEMRVLHHHSVFRIHSSPLFLKSTPFFQIHPPLLKTSLRRHHRFPINSVSQNPFQSSESIPKTPEKPKPRTLFPSGFKRPEIKVPCVVLQLDAAEVLSGGDALDLIDRAVSKWVGIVVLNSGEGGGGKLYEAACKLKSVVGDRAYLLIAERVDIATAVNANGVVLSDQGLPPLVARNTMLDSMSDSLFLPLVARNVKSSISALNASKSEGADFLLYDFDEEKLDMTTDSVFKNVKIPIFILFSSYGENITFHEALKWLEFGASGLVISLQALRLLSTDAVGKLFDSIFTENGRKEDDVESANLSGLLNMGNGAFGTTQVAGFANLEDREKQVIETEKLVLREAINVIQKAAPLMEEVSLLNDSISQIDEPFMLAIVGEFNSGKSTVINALLGRRYLKDGVVPTTNEITFLRFSELNSNEQQRCERHPDGQYICYLPAPILNEMNIVDTPGTNVILERQQRLTEEFVPRADLLLFVISADRPLTESEVNFLRYTQQWKKKVVFVLNKSDLYQNSHELEEALSFVKENAAKLLNTEHVFVFPVSARSALDEKLSASLESGEVLSPSNSYWRSSSFHELENFLYSFLDGSTSNGMERMKLKLQTPVSIAERLLSAAETLVRQDIHFAKQDLASLNELVDGVRNYGTKMENESITWRRQASSLIDSTQSRIMKLVESTLQLSNFDIAAYYVLKGEKTTTLSATSKIQNDIISPALADAQKLLQDYESWLQSGNAHEGIVYQESLQKLWPSIVFPATQMHFETYELLKKVDDLSLKVIKNFSPSAASKLFDQEIREAFLGTFGGLGAAGLSASLLTSVLPTTTEDLLALGLCSAGGFLAISNFPSRRQQLVSKVKRTADGFARELEAAMQEDLNEAVRNLETFVSVISKPYRDEAQNRLDKLLEIQDELSNVGKKLQKLQNEIQNLHVS